MPRTKTSSCVLRPSTSQNVHGPLRVSADTRNGPWTFWDVEGRKTHELVFVRGKRHGSYVEFHVTTGKPKMRGQYTNAKRQGTWTVFFEDGQKQAQGPVKGEASPFTGPWACF